MVGLWLVLVMHQTGWANAGECAQEIRQRQLFENRKFESPRQRTHRERRVHGPGGGEFAADNPHLTGPPVAKLSRAKNRGAFQQSPHRRVTPRLEPSQRDVAGKPFRLPCRREWPHRLVHPPVKFRQLPAVVIRPGPDHARPLLIREKSDAVRRQTQGRTAGANRSHEFFQRLHLRRRHVTEKFQRDVKLLRPRPANGTRRGVAPQLTLGASDFLPHVRRDGEGDEQAQERR